jgi:endonuclease/exonuclease/phosphatase (EEP) superfamily protein YafD
MAMIARAISVAAVWIAFALGGVCLVAGLAAQCGRFNTRLDVLTHFAPFWLAGALAVAACGLVLAPSGLRPALLGVAVVGALASALLIIPELTRPIRPTVAPGAHSQIKLIQFNAWVDNRNVEATADWLAGQKPDFVLMEEVEPPIAEAMVKRGFNYVRGSVHTAIFAREAPAPSPFKIAAGDWSTLPAFTRGAFTGPGAGFSLIAVHLNWPTDAVQATQIEALANLVDRYDRNRLILAGDFNLTPWSFTLRRLDHRFGLERRDRALFSWPAQLILGGRLRPPLPFLPIDHLYAGSAWRTVAIERGPRLGSDHYPLVATLALED